MKRGIISCICAITIMLVAVFVNLSAKPEQIGQASDNIPEEVSDFLNNMTDSEAASGYSLYSDYSENFSELEAHASVVLYGSAIKVEPKSAVAQEATIIVDKVFAGECDEQITVYQMLGDNSLTVGTEYLLFLAPQFPDDADSNVFYVIGGAQGIMEIDHAEQEIVVNSQHIIDDDFKSWLCDQAASPARLSAHTGEADLNYLVYTPVLRDSAE